MKLNEKISVVTKTKVETHSFSEPLHHITNLIMKSVNFYFKGLMCPVFTPFTTDRYLVFLLKINIPTNILYCYVCRKNVNYAVIDAYAFWLKQRGIKGVLVNGTVSEGTNLSIDERKRITEEWWKVCKKYELVLMVQIGGTCITDVYELAAHAEDCGVSAVLCLPDLFFRPNIEEDLVEYFKDISRYCPTRPFYYYHIPQFSRVKCKSKIVNAKNDLI